MGECLEIDRRDGGVTAITLHDGKVNALSTGLLNELADAARELSSPSSSCRVVVISGGPRLFAAGASIDEFALDSSPDAFEIAPPAVVRKIGTAFLTALNSVAAIPVPTIASISGYALGGGCELALACDLRIASSSAKFGQPEIFLGIIPGGGATQRLARLVGPAVAKDLVFTGRTIDATEALRIGLINRVVEPDRLDTETDELAAQLAKGPRVALALAKHVIDGGLDITLEEGLRLEQDHFVEVFATSDAAVGVRSFLLEGPGKAEFGR